MPFNEAVVKAGAGGALLLLLVIVEDLLVERGIYGLVRSEGMSTDTLLLLRDPATFSV
jgi:hypothetical protein